MIQTEGKKQAVRIAITTYILNMGGISNFIIELGKFLKSKGYVVSVICTDRKGNWYQRIEQEGLHGKYFNSGIYEWIPFGRILFARRIGAYMRKQSFDFIINNHSFYIHAAAGYFYDLSRIIHVVHNQLEQMVERESDPLSDKVVGVSPRIEELAGRYLPAKVLTCILNGISLPEEAAKPYDNCSDRPGDILFVGRIDNRQKAVFMIPDILGRLLLRHKGVRLTVVGEGPDLDKLRQLTARRSLTEHIRFTGRVAPAGVEDYYREHKILLLPSNFEGHPLTLMEAMAHACVPVSSLLPQCTDICIEQGSSGYLVEPGKADEFAQRIAELLGSPDLLNLQSKNAAKRARDHFSSSLSHGKYLELIQSFEGREMKRNKTTLINRKYLSWKEMVPFRGVLFFKRIILKAF
ncbi:MAG: glycosyltransferase family 4 protein [Bacteroidales bacterium]|nr:glycosyltransferase family 4 protein [Bacteroidales bacterium]